MTAPRLELTSQRQKVSRLPTEAPGDRSVRGTCAPCPIKVLARPPRAPWEEAPAGFPELGSTAMKKAMVRSRAAREKGAMSFVEYLGASQEDTMEDPLWRETLGRSLESNDAAELVGGMCHVNGCRQ